MTGFASRFVAALLTTTMPAVGNCTDASDPGEALGHAALGGPSGTTEVDDQMAYSAPVPVLGADQRTDFAAGRRLFRVVWRERAFSEDTAGTAGLGPLFNHRSCAGCHVRNGRGRPPDADLSGPANGMIWRVLYPEDGKALTDRPFGAQVQDQAVPGTGYEARIALSYREMPGQFADGAAYSLRAPSYRLNLHPEAKGHAPGLSPRIPPAVIGGGLIEAVDQAELAALADPFDQDGDGISGRLSVIQSGEAKRLGRFGWKASQATLRDQVVEATAEDFGLASRDRPHGGCARIQIQTLPSCAQEVEIAASAIDQIVSYLRGLAVPSRRDVADPTVRRGATLFMEAGCARCHVPSLPTGDYPPFPALGNQIIHPFTDLLLHDMGPGLADPASDGATDAREWRTAPLWGIGLTADVNGNGYFLHDGRARSLMEAVLWHGGEAVAARESVLAMSRHDRTALVAFLRSL